MNTSNYKPSSTAKPGVTLVEIMIVVVIIGILAVMAGVAFKHTRDRAIATRVANDLRIFADAFQPYTLENGSYPPDVGPVTVPAGVEEYMNTSIFTSTTLLVVLAIGMKAYLELLLPSSFKVLQLETTFC